MSHYMVLIKVKIFFSFFFSFFFPFFLFFFFFFSFFFSFLLSFSLSFRGRKWSEMERNGKIGENEWRVLLRVGRRVAGQRQAELQCPSLIPMPLRAFLTCVCVCVS